jgi:Methyltransferase domain
MSERGRLLVRRLGRVRWIRKAGKLRSTGPGAWSGRPLRIARYVLLDPEVDTYSYEIDNHDALSERLALVTGHPATELRRYVHEALEDPEFRGCLTRDIGWRVLFFKRRPPLAGHHLAAYAAVRAIKPRVAVETGILDGLGSRTMLRALERNAGEGREGHLWSFDIMPGAGALVPERLRERWTPVYRSTRSALPELLRERRLDFFVHDSLPDAGYQRFELESALAGAQPGAVLMTVHGWTGVLEELSQSAGLPYADFRERPRDHFYGGRHLAWASAQRASAPAG